MVKERRLKMRNLRMTMKSTVVGRRLSLGLLLSMNLQEKKVKK
jgi:hypothetical protein